jgi:6-phosphogluconolactonase/glucosamine-6-phosphate isomerase/deaminase
MPFDHTLIVIKKETRTHKRRFSGLKGGHERIRRAASQLALVVAGGKLGSEIYRGRLRRHRIYNLWVINIDEFFGREALHLQIIDALWFFHILKPKL